MKYFSIGFYIVVILFFHRAEVDGSKFSKEMKKKREESHKNKVIPPPLDDNLLPPLQDILTELELDHRLSSMIQYGVTDTRRLVRLNRMDYSMMTMNWDGDSTGDVDKLKAKVSSLLETATLKEVPGKEMSSERNKLKQGRIYVSSFVNSIEYVSASFGSPPPVGPLQLTIADPIEGCEEEVNSKNVEGHMLIVSRGGCTFLEKAMIAKKRKVAVLAIVNNDDYLESFASGVGIVKNVTEQMSAAVSSISVVTVSNTSLASFQSVQSDELRAHVVPLKCGAGGRCLPAVTSEEQYQIEIIGGVVSVLGEQEDRHDFLTSNFGGFIPLNENVIVRKAEPYDACEPLLHTMKGQAVVVTRGGCRFDVKALNVQLAGGKFMIVVDTEDNPLQRVGGMHPTVGYVGIPSIYISQPGGQSLLNRISSSDEVMIKLKPFENSNSAEAWIELAYMQWEGSQQDMLAQADGLIQKYASISDNQGLIDWVNRKKKSLQETCEP